MKKIIYSNPTFSNIHVRTPKIRLFPLGGTGRVTKNMYVYEYWSDNKIQDILLIDCGIGFPEEGMYGVDVVIPDIKYLHDKKDRIRGMVLTHGHEDHFGGLPYILPMLPRFPIFATRLTAAFAESKLKEFGINTKINVIKFSDNVNLGHFQIEPVHVTHSIPDAANFVIRTPVGNFYHGSDFKFDLTPLDQQPSELNKIARAGEKGVWCLLSDCLGSQEPGFTLSERVIQETIEKEISRTQGKFIFTTQSSNIFRIQQAINVGVKYNRKIAIVGRSMEQNTETAVNLGYLSFPPQTQIFNKQILRYADNQLFLIISGSQGQADSALFRIARGEHKFIKIRDGDVVVFSADPIPGNESAVHNLVDILTRNGAYVSYSEIVENLHVSGHGIQQDLRLMLALTKPKYILPIGGTFRHMIAYKQLALEMGYRKDQILLPEEGEVLEFNPNQKPHIAAKIDLDQIMVDGLGIGDVGDIVLRDRVTLANEGIMVIVVPVDQDTGRVTTDPDIISRGFVYMKESTFLVKQVKKVVIRTLQSHKGRISDWQYIRRNIEEDVSKLLFKETGRRPLIVPVVIQV